MFKTLIKDYLEKLNNSFSDEIMEKIIILAEDLEEIWRTKKTLFICGNGGSGGNAIHIANDFHYGIGCSKKGPDVPGIIVDALTSNQAVITCLANDLGYEYIFSNQLKVKAKKGDLLLVLSGSGNSKNIINAILKAREMDVKSYGIFGFDGGKAKNLVDQNIHFKIDDMQISEDLQLIVCHLCMQWLNTKKGFLLKEVKS